MGQDNMTPLYKGMDAPGVESWREKYRRLFYFIIQALAFALSSLRIVKLQLPKCGRLSPHGLYALP